jgi:Flagellar protein FliT
MIDKNLLEPLHQIIEQVNVLLVFAREENWDELQENLGAYQNQLTILEQDTYLDALRDSQLTGSAQDLILQIQDLNQQLDLLAVGRHEKIASELRLMAQSTKALDAYSR